MASMLKHEVYRIAKTLHASLYDTDQKLSSAKPKQFYVLPVRLHFQK